jgi:hypothetical protein
MYVLIGHVTFILFWSYGIVGAYRGAERISAQGA